MKLHTYIFLAVLSANALLANEAVDLIQKEGSLKFSDGSSVYYFTKDGRFELEPVGISGRTISGKWKSNDRHLIIEGEWSWMNGTSIPGDIRTMSIYVSPTTEKQVVGHRKEQVTKVYFIIDSIQKK